MFTAKPYVRPDREYHGRPCAARGLAVVRVLVA